jgi:uncharacterized protein YndB with AHSA1/START domain
MTQRSAQHATFAIERKLSVPPAKVFAAFATEEGKSKWFAGGTEWKEQVREFDFRVGGRERVVGQWAHGMVSDFNCLYQDIVPDQRIVYTYEMHINGNRISISLATIEFKPEGAGTRLLLTEQGVFLDGHDDAGSREKGTRGLMDRMEASLSQAEVPDLATPKPH